MQLRDIIDLPISPDGPPIDLMDLISIPFTEFEQCKGQCYMSYKSGTLFTEKDGEMIKKLMRGRKTKVRGGESWGLLVMKRENIDP